MPVLRAGLIGTGFSIHGWPILESASTVARPLVGRRILILRKIRRNFESSDPQGVGLQFAFQDELASRAFRSASSDATEFNL